MKNFLSLLLLEIIENIENNFDDNYDYYRFGKKKRLDINIKSKIKKYILKILNANQAFFNIPKYRTNIESLSEYFERLENLYNLLEDEDSKQLLVKIIAFRILGEDKVKLPLNNVQYWTGIKKFEGLKIDSSFIEVPFVSGKKIKLFLHELQTTNVPLKIFLTSRGLYSNLFVNQYEYDSPMGSIKIQPGEIVLDCGGCWGDTALFFANKVGDSGHVFSFEFVPSNIKTFRINQNMNPVLSQRISLVENPLGITLNESLHFIDNGPGTTLVKERVNNSTTVQTTTIDAFVSNQRFQKVDYIKMDIEGAELMALKGGEKTIKKFKPKLAISIYHSMDDFVDIPAYIHSLNLGYRFYLNHGTIHTEETVLICRSEERENG